MQSCLLKITNKLQTNLESQIYQNHGPIPIEESLYFTFANCLLQTTELINLRKSTKFIAKKIFDIFLCAHLQTIPEQQLKINLFNSIALAAKVNEPSHLIQNFAAIVSLSQGQYALQYDNFEAKIYEILGINFYILTPYYFTEGISGSKQQEKLTMIIDSIIDFGITIPKMRVYTPTSIFLGSFAYLIKSKKCELFSKTCKNCLILINNKLVECPQATEIAHIIHIQLEKQLNNGN